MQNLIIVKHGKHIYTFSFLDHQVIQLSEKMYEMTLDKELNFDIMDAEAVLDSYSETILD